LIAKLPAGHDATMRLVRYLESLYITTTFGTPKVTFFYKRW
jgi:hypothetical protein